MDVAKTSVCPLDIQKLYLMYLMYREKDFIKPRKWESSRNFFNLIAAGISQNFLSL